jgi:cyclopropane-fatty-acyl-phospholipid synthase
MARSSGEHLVRELLASAGVEVGGPAPHDIRVQDPRFYRRVLRQGSLGLGEAYMDGWWEAEAVDEFIARLLAARVRHRVGAGLRARVHAVAGCLWNLQNRVRARRAVAAHYDLGNDLFSRMLDPSMSYSCGYWAHARDLVQAQRDKLELICRKLGLAPGMQVLDIGCGWGGFARHAAKHHGAQVTGITLSRAQADHARETCEGLPVAIELCDYRDYESAPVDRIVSVGMFEHVGARNYRTFMRSACRLLKPDGLLLLHSIGSPITTRGNDPWLDKYIFPDGELPSATQLARATEGLLILEDWHNFGPDYDRTLMAWKANFEAAWPELKERYGERFRRMWQYYLSLCAGAFRARHLQLWQLVLAPPGRRAETYRSVR